MLPGARRPLSRQEEVEWTQFWDHWRRQFPGLRDHEWQDRVEFNEARLKWMRDRGLLPVPEPSGDGLRYILVIDDDTANRDLIVTVARRIGLGARQATNGIAAIEQLERSPAPVAIILDLDMPVMDGMEFLGAIREVPGVSGIPIIVVSGVTEVGDLQSRGVVAFLPKPIDIQLLDEILRSATE